MEESDEGKGNWGRIKRGGETRGRAGAGVGGCVPKDNPD